MSSLAFYLFQYYLCVTDIKSTRRRRHQRADSHVQHRTVPERQRCQHVH